MVNTRTLRLLLIATWGFFLLATAGAQTDLSQIVISGTGDDVKGVVSRLNLRPNTYGWTWLMDAARSNPNADVISVLVQAGSDVNAKNNNGDTALLLAANFNPNPEVISALIVAGAEINATTSSGMTALMLAAYKNTNPNVVSVLLRAGADADMKNNNGWTALGLAQQNPHMQNTNAYQQLAWAVPGICFWTDGDFNINVWANGSYVGKLTQHFSSGTPAWGQYGTLMANLAPGTYTIVGRLENGVEVGAPTRTTVVRHMLFLFPGSQVIAAVNQSVSRALGNLSSAAHTAAGLTGNNQLNKLGDIFSDAQKIDNILSGN